jgi:muramoyltetrapeptide carboxypeptidase
MISPPYLKPGDKIAIVAPARKVSPAEIEPAIKIFREWGLQVVTSPHLFGDYHQFSGTDTERTADLQMMLDDPEIKAVFSARGGYGTLRIIDQIDFSKFCSHPKWIVGFSDATVLHSHIHTQFGIETIHGAMPFSFGADGADSNNLTTLKKALFGEELQYDIPATEHNNEGEAEAILTGGNLSILYAVNGSASDLNTEGKILFIEDLDEYLYHIDRMMLNLKRSGKLHSLAGMIVGGMSKMNDNPIPFGKTAESIIKEAVAEYDYPVCFGFPAGHIPDNRALILGRTVKFVVNENSSSITFVNNISVNKLSKLPRIIKPLLIFLAFFVFIYLIYSLLIPALQ